VHHGTAAIPAQHIYDGLHYLPLWHQVNSATYSSERLRN